jgi:DNA-binding MarR family transcriptional regulator
MNKKNLIGSEQNQKESVSPVPETRIVQLLLKCGLFLEREMNQVCQRFGLKQQQFSALNTIIWHGPINQKELGETLFFEKSNVSKIIKILFEKRWIQISVDPHDRRLTLLSETPEGAAVWKECMQAFQESSKNLTAYLSEKEAANVIKVLKKMEKSFRETKRR